MDRHPLEGFFGVHFRSDTDSRMTKDYILLTGVTGQVGQALLRDTLLAFPDRVAVLVRSKGGVSGRHRIEGLRSQWALETGESLPHPVCLDGDTTSEGFGLSQRDRQWVRQHCDTLMHNAATIEFSGKGTRQTWDNNVLNAHRALEVCHESRIDHLAYTSTAYVCGMRRGMIYEDELEMGQEFRNEYEHSKYEAERILRGSSYPDVVTVMRPSVVVGDYRSGCTRTYHSFYRAVQFTAAIASAAEKDSDGYWAHDIRLTLTGDEISNLVCVDWVSSTMTSILSSSACFGKTFHLTPKHPTTCKEIERALQEFFCYTGVKFVGTRTNRTGASGTGASDLADSSPDERRFYQYMEEYSDYWGNEPVFDRDQTDQVVAAPVEGRIDVPCLKRLINYAVEDRFGKKNRRLSKAKNR